MVPKAAFIFCIIGVLVFASKIKAQEPLGTPGVDYPNYFTIPETSFKCSDQKYNPGFYADLETKCQAFHFCYQDRQESFLCPTGTIFNQAVLTCDVWYKSNCSLAQMFYSVNVGPVMERAGKNLPMLLRLRNRSQNKPSMQTTSSVVDKVSSLYETDKFPVDSKNELQYEASDKSDALLKDFDKDEVSDRTKHGFEEGSEETDNSELTNEGVEEEMVYDSNEENYRNYDQSEEGWKDSEPMSDFYGYDRNYEGYDRSYEDYESESLLNDMEENESVEDSDLIAVDDLDYPEFRRRNSQVGYSRVRRKPVYFVLDDQPEVETGETTIAVDNKENSSISSNSETRESKEMNFNSKEYANEETPKPEPFPRPTPIPLHLREEISTHNPMTSDEFGEAILRELVLPYNEKTQSDDETIYIENDVEPETYSEFSSQYEDVPESYEESHSQDVSDTDDTFVVIPDEYDNVEEPFSSEDSEMDHLEETAYREQMLAAQPDAGYDAYENYQYSPNVGYPEYYGQSMDYPEFTPGIYQNVMPSDQRYSYENYEYPGQVPVNYESSSYDAENAYAERYPYENEFEVTERPLPLPVTEADLDSLSTEDFNEIDQDLTEPEQTEDVYYVLDEDEVQSSKENETKASESAFESSKFDQVNDQNQGLDQTNSSVDESSLSNKYLNDAETQDKSTETGESSVWSSNSPTISQQEHIELSDEKYKSSNSMNTEYGSNLGQSSKLTPPAHESLPVNDQSFSSNVGSFDFSTDSRFLNNMGYSESMDFGPYGFGPNMGHQFNMMESMQQSSNPFSQRLGQSEQPKVSRLSVIQEKMRNMKQGKFGAFKKYMSSTNK